MFLFFISNLYVRMNIIASRVAAIVHRIPLVAFYDTILRFKLAETTRTATYTIRNRTMNPAE